MLKMVVGSHPHQLGSTGFTPGPKKFKGLVKEDSKFDHSLERSKHRSDGVNLLAKLQNMEATNAAWHTKLNSHLGS